jgi:hypothetical protein
MNDLMAYKLYKKKKKTEKLMKRKNDLKNDVVCGQIINICKLGAN